MNTIYIITGIMFTLLLILVFKIKKKNNLLSNNTFFILSLSLLIGFILELIINKTISTLDYKSTYIIGDLYDYLKSYYNGYIIEHNLDIIKQADYIIDLGPEGGDFGGTIVAKGTPEEVVKVKESYTGQYLKDYLK